MLDMPVGIVTVMMAPLGPMAGLLSGVSRVLPSGPKCRGLPVEGHVRGLPVSSSMRVPGAMNNSSNEEQ